MQIQKSIFAFWQKKKKKVVSCNRISCITQGSKYHKVRDEAELVNWRKRCQAVEKEQEVENKQKLKGLVKVSQQARQYYILPVTILGFDTKICILSLYNQFTDIPQRLYCVLLLSKLTFGFHSKNPSKHWFTRNKQNSVFS